MQTPTRHAYDIRVKWSEAIPRWPSDDQCHQCGGELPEVEIRVALVPDEMNLGDDVFCSWKCVAADALRMAIDDGHFEGQTDFDLDDPALP